MASSRLTRTRRMGSVKKNWARRPCLPIRVERRAWWTWTNCRERAELAIWCIKCHAGSAYGSESNNDVGGGLVRESGRGDGVQIVGSRCHKGGNDVLQVIGDTLFTGNYETPSDKRELSAFTYWATIDDRSD